MEALFDFKRIDTSPELVSPSFVAPSEGRIFQPSFMVPLEEEEKIHSTEYKDRHRGSYIFTATRSLAFLFCLLRSNGRYICWPRPSLSVFIPITFVGVSSSQASEKNSTCTYFFFCCRSGWILASCQKKSGWISAYSTSYESKSAAFPVLAWLSSHFRMSKSLPAKRDFLPVKTERHALVICTPPPTQPDQVSSDRYRPSNTSMARPTPPRRYQSRE